jgi:purine-nucleoside phosphorylase
MDLQLQETISAIRAQYTDRPKLAVILGSGLGAVADALQERVLVPYSDLPHFPLPTAPGHSGVLAAGKCEGIPTLILQGRVHYYEGRSIGEVAYPARVLGCLGIRYLVVTNSAGGINPSFRSGDLMLIMDHINLMGTNPLIGPNDGKFGERFPDMSQAYDPGAIETARIVATQIGLTLRTGVYAAVAGPSYETPAEIRMLRIVGADAVGMSTIPEVIVANHMGIRVLGISCITNMAAGVLPQKLSHAEVMKAAGKFEGKLVSLLKGIATRLPGMS